MNERDLDRLIARAESLLGRLEALLPAAPAPPDWKARAFRWRKRGQRGYLQPVSRPHAISLDDLVAIDAQKRTIERNTRQFVAGLPANLGSGARERLVFGRNEPGLQHRHQTWSETISRRT